MAEGSGVKPQCWSYPTRFWVSDAQSCSTGNTLRRRSRYNSLGLLSFTGIFPLYHPVSAMSQATSLIDHKCIVNVYFSPARPPATIPANVVKDLRTRRIQCDEVHAFLHAKAKTIEEGRAKAPPKEAGTVWTWTALEQYTKLIITWNVSPTRNFAAASKFIGDLRLRVTGRAEISTDALMAYEPTIDKIFGEDVDYGQVVKYYSNGGGGRYPRYTHSDKRVILGNPRLYLRIWVRMVWLCLSTWEVVMYTARYHVQQEDTEPLSCSSPVLRVVQLLPSTHEFGRLHSSGDGCWPRGGAAQPRMAGESRGRPGGPSGVGAEAGAACGLERGAKPQRGWT